jgi:hypothetical protein
VKFVHSVLKYAKNVMLMLIFVLNALKTEKVMIVIVHLEPILYLINNFVQIAHISASTVKKLVLHVLNAWELELIFLIVIVRLGTMRMLISNANSANSNA